MPDGFGEEWTELDNFFGGSGHIQVEAEDAASEEEDS